MSLSQEIPVVILSAGLSARMGSPKALLQFSSAKTFLEKISDTYISCGFASAVVVVNKEVYESSPLRFSGLHERKSFRFLVNEHPQKGRFYSIKSALSALNDCEFCFLQNVDNPFVSRQLIKELLKFKKQDAYCVPYFQDHGGHPILISRNIIECIKTTEGEDVNLKTVLDKFQKIMVETADEKVLVNINSPLDYMKYFPDEKLMSMVN